jgi:glycosyltransferase involved in cell wall biosynthesis
MTNPATAVHTIAILGNHLPRRCGIATFTTDLRQAIQLEFPELDCFVLAMNDAGRRHEYPAVVRFELAESDITAYRRASDFLNVNAVDVVCVQHEFGIFGGKAGDHVLTLLRGLRMPVVTTLHTILAKPSPPQRDTLLRLIGLSERVVVMSEHGGMLLRDVYGISEQKIDCVPHGIPNAPRAVDSRRSKHRLGVEGKSVILTFGLLSPDKGIEQVIDALPAIVERCPDAVYIVLGATHPHLKERQGETYRLALENQAQRIGVAGNIIFHDRFVTDAELAEFLAAADVYITPYVNLEQIASGTLARAVGAGKAVVSTPYWYARELLAEGRGILVPWRDPAAIARETSTLLCDDAARSAIGERAAAYGREMLWPAVARRYLSSFERAIVDHADRRRTTFQAMTLAKRPAVLPETNLSHLDLMTDCTGVLQHSEFGIPRYEDGYCLDDNARALLLMVLLEDLGTEEGDMVRALSLRYLAFLRHAFDWQQGRFRNFMSYSRMWLEESGSEDSHARALWALGTVVGRSSDPGKQSLGGQLFHAALRPVESFTSPRAWAFTLLGVGEYLRAFQGDSSVQSVLRVLSTRLLQLYQRSSSPEWPWFEEYLTYSNARLSQALMVSGAWLESEAMTTAAIQSLDWLAKEQTSDEGYFAPIGSNGFYKRDGLKASFDQQPVEACAMISACVEASRMTGDGSWATQARRAFNWFVGQNQLQQSLYDARTGGCRDGIQPDRLNENQGAESTISFQLALLEMRTIERTQAVRLVTREARR